MFQLVYKYISDIFSSGEASKFIHSAKQFKTADGKLLAGLSLQDWEWEMGNGKWEYGGLRRLRIY